MDMGPCPGCPRAFVSGIAPLPGSMPPTPYLSRQPQGKTRSINMRLHLGPGGALGTVQVLNIIALLSFKWSLPQTGHPVLATSTGQNPH